MTLAGRVSLVLTCVFAAVTLGLVIYAVTRTGEELGSALVTYSTVPLFGALAVGPYVLAHRQSAHAVTPLWSWIYIAVNIAAAAVIPIYVHAFVTAATPPASPNVIFVLLPGCQLLFIGALMALEHLGRRRSGAE